MSEFSRRGCMNRKNEDFVQILKLSLKHRLNESSFEG